ncbi:phosphotransferase [Nostoc sp. DSM 114167]|jgi:thiamine kinase-like enzyme|uniref:phosphotransferase n=1 Tax=Nostoc sp. DSM 114167 TaxID=3439050 RepID=UPI0040466E95
MTQITLQSLIPEAKLEAVEKALQTTFNTKTVESIELLTGGLSSALVYKIIVNGKAYVLRIVIQIDELSDPVRQYICMNIAAEAGIAPIVYYTNAVDAVSITDFIRTISLSEHFGSPDNFLPKLANVVKSIHSLPNFPKLVNFLDGIDLFIQQFQALEFLPASATEEHFRYYSEIQQFYPRYDTDVVASHNDLNPNNILFDGKKIWLIDWGVAFQNDRYVDLANVANYFMTNAAQAEIYLRSYFGDFLDNYKRARFFLMQQVCQIFYAIVFLKLAAASWPENLPIEYSMVVPSLKEFQQQLRTDKVILTTHEGQLLYGKIRLNQALYNMKTARFAESIKIIRNL